ncbi:MAG: hypothetical protein JRE58_08345 [Deltaproteobacteria bacterium]|nr:hypothetical protein [Deltaproteobacteria bacterium]
MKLRYTARAREDLELAFMWYEKRQFHECRSCMPDTMLISGVPWCGVFLSQFFIPLKKRESLFTLFLTIDKTRPECHNYS